MYSLSIVGWFHTIAGTLAIFIGIYLISKFSVISSKSNLGKIYLILTIITAATSLMIFNNGGFNLAHLLGVFALLGVFLGFLFEHEELFDLSKYFQAICYTGTMLCHLIPGISEVFTRVPPSQPIANSIFDPILLVSFGIFFLIYLITVFFQILHLKNNS
tara:strand:+ start:529 stop:1008 length:480 start_codon:yes stop_codon:yes gene_type:complete